MALPSNVSFGTVTGTFIRGVADSTDDPDRDPDVKPIVGMVLTFKPSLKEPFVRDTGATPPAFIGIDKVTCVTDATGTLIGPDGVPGVRLISPMNLALNPTGWTWNVQCNAPTFPQLSFDFDLPPGAVVDLATVTPVTASAGVPGGISTGGSAPFADNGDGTYTPATLTVTDAGDGTWNSSGAVTDLGDGTFNLAA